MITSWHCSYLTLALVLSCSYALELIVIGMDRGLKIRDELRLELLHSGFRLEFVDVVSSIFS